VQALALDDNAAMLSAIEARIVGVLVEKQRTVPDTYPLSLSALTAGCNQKTARDPVTNLTEPQVLAALESLRSRDWILETSGSRVMRYAHNADRVLQVPALGLVLLAVLALRGPQTAAELRANAERWHRFADVSSVEGFLQELAERGRGALAARLAKEPGSREHRWASLLTGPLPDAPADVGLDDRRAVAIATVPGAEIESLRERIGALELEVSRLRAELQALRAPT
jgi:uncharacterized protein